MPPELLGKPYGCEIEDLAAQDMPTQYTILFREGTEIDKVFDMVADRSRPNGSPLHVISAGCSYGAEVDTVLALAHKYLPGTVEITGVDSSETALREAKLARYRISPSIGAAIAKYSAQSYDFFATMQEYGLDAQVLDKNGCSSVLSSERLRSSHRVTWRSGNLASDAMTELPADLILCNNVIYHYYEDIPLANAITANLGSNLASGGILSFGANLSHAGMDDWVRNQATPLLAEQGIVPVASNSQSLVAFQRLDT